MEESGEGKFFRIPLAEAKEYYLMFPAAAKICTKPRDQ